MDHMFVMMSDFKPFIVFFFIVDIVVVCISVYIVTHHRSMVRLESLLAKQEREEQEEAWLSRQPRVMTAVENARGTRARSAPRGKLRLVVNNVRRKERMSDRDEDEGDRQA